MRCTGDAGRADGSDSVDCAGHVVGAMVQEIQLWLNLQVLTEIQLVPKVQYRGHNVRSRLYSTVTCHIM